MSGSQSHKSLISIIIPVYNEEGNLEAAHAQIDAVSKKHPEHDFEFIFVNDGSRDKSWSLISTLAKKDLRVLGLNFSRNFGHQMALTAGYDACRGDAIISIDCDLQDPPEIISQLIDEWEKGADIVYARRRNRVDSWIKKVTANIYYRILSRTSDVIIPRNVGDFRLIDKKVLWKINACRERSRYLRGLVAWMGYKQAFVDFDRQGRVHGQSGYSWSKMLKLAFDGFTGFSVFPLKMAAFVGIFVLITGTLMFSWITFDSLINDVRYPLYKWLMVIVYAFFGVNFILLWILGEYIGRIHDQAKNRPLYVVQESTGSNMLEELYEEDISNWGSRVHRFARREGVGQQGI